jgi:hypothetical protein
MNIYRCTLKDKVIMKAFVNGGSCREEGKEHELVPKLGLQKKNYFKVS